MLQFHCILLIVSDRWWGLKGRETDRDRQILTKRKMLRAKWWDRREMGNREVPVIIKGTEKPMQKEWRVPGRRVRTVRGQRWGPERLQLGKAGAGQGAVDPTPPRAGPQGPRDMSDGWARISEWVVTGPGPHDYSTAWLWVGLTRQYVLPRPHQRKAHLVWFLMPEPPLNPQSPVQKTSVCWPLRY